MGSSQRRIQNNTKRNFWDELLEATCTPTPLHQDKYEEPREIKTFRINCIKANTYTHAKSAGAARTSHRQTASECISTAAPRDERPPWIILQACICWQGEECYASGELHMLCPVRDRRRKTTACSPNEHLLGNRDMEARSALSR
jgi:hypothetical protein